MRSTHTPFTTRLVALTLTATLAALGACATDDVDPDEAEGNNAENNLRPGQDLGTPTSDMGEEPADMGQATDQGSEDNATTEDMAAAEDMTSTQQDMATLEDMTPTPDAGADMAAEEDMAAMVDACGDQLTLNTTFTIDPNGLAGQYYSRTAFDGDGIWVVYGVRESAMIGAADVWATRLACDGATDVAPFLVSASPSGVQDVFPAIAVRDDDVYIAWTQESQGTNKPFMRSFKRDGTPNQSAPVELTPQLGGLPLSNLIWETDVAALPNGEAALAASFFSEKAGTFQIMVQRFDRAGNLVGDAMEAFEEKGVEQTRPSITALDDGTIYVSWTRYKPADMMAGTPEEPHRVVYTKIAPGASEPDVAGPFPAQPGGTADNQLGRYSKERTASDAVYLAFQLDSTGANDVLVKDGTFGAPLSFATLGGSNSVDLRPSVAARPDGLGGAVVWYRADPSPIRNEVIVQPFDTSSGLSAGNELVVPTSDPARPPYGPSIAHVDGQVYFVTWSEGPSTSDTRIKGRFVLP